MSKNHYSPDLRSKSKSSKEFPIIGFINNWGESNCFLNSALQVLFHLDKFRNSLLSFGDCSPSSTHYCLLCGLKDIFNQYKQKSSSTRASPIDISRLRGELAYKYESRNSFSINEPADSMEALSALLSSLHDDHHNQCSKACPAHPIFQIQVEEKLICQCKASKEEKWDFNTFSHHFYVHVLFEETEEKDIYALIRKKKIDIEIEMELSNVMMFENNLMSYIRRQWEDSVYKTCPSDCKLANSRKILKLKKLPKVFAINLIWKDFNPKLIKIMQIMLSVPYSLKLDSIYDVTGDNIYNLKSIILYGRGHYICAIRIGISRQWHKIDDEKGRLVGNWYDFVNDCLSNRYYPVGLFYDETNQWEESGIAPNDWIKLEKKVLNYLKNNEDTQEDQEWTCKCGNSNNSHWTYCTKCQELRPGLSGWICKVCTFYNNSDENNCRSCEQRRSPREEGKLSRTYNGIDKVTMQEKEKKGENEEKSPKDVKYQTLNSRNPDGCVCRQRKCICERCKKCKKLFNGSCKNCESIKKCTYCKEELKTLADQICAWCKTPASSGRCTRCKGKEEKLTCERCSNTLKRCGSCGTYNDPNLTTCVEAGCKQNLNAKYIIDLTKKINMQITPQKPIATIKCELCSSEISRAETKFCVICFENRKKCKTCTSKLILCESCFKNKEKCKYCAFPFTKGEKCINQDCMSNSHETQPNRINEVIKSCEMCGDDLPGYGLCLNCKLKLKSDRCCFCDIDACYKFCENCINYTIKCKHCSKSKHITEKTCLTCN